MDPTSAPPPVLIDVAPAYGASLIGCFIAFAAWGILSMQTFLYFLNYAHDPPKFKVLVAFLWLMDSGHMIVLSKGMWSALVENFGNPAVLTQWFPELFVQVLFTGIVALATQSFFTYRIWMFSERNPIFLLVLSPLSLTQFGGNIAYVILTLKTPTVETLHRYQWLIYMVNSLAAGIDLIIALVMCVLLWKGRTGLRRSDQMMARMMVIVVHTGTITAVFALLTVILLLSSQTTEIFTAAYGPLCPLYCNTVIANLNARAYIRGSGDGGAYMQKEGTTSGSSSIPPKPNTVRKVGVEASASGNKSALPTAVVVKTRVSKSADERVEDRPRDSQLSYSKDIKDYSNDFAA